MAKFQKGMKKPENSGRKKGTPNKSTQKVSERLIELNFDPVEELVSLYKRVDEPEAKLVDLKIIQTLMQYTFYLPKNPLELPNAAPPPPQDLGLTDEEIEEKLRD
jgi:hypothetical protein